MGVFSVVFVGAMLLILIAFLVEFFSQKKYFKSSIRYGVFWAVIIFLLDGLMLILTKGSLLSFASFIVVIMVFLRTIMYVSVGDYHCGLLQIDDMPLTKRLFIKLGKGDEDQTVNDVEAEDTGEEESKVEYIDEVEANELSTIDVEIPREVNREIEWKKLIFWTIITIIGAIAYSMILFKITSPEASDALKNIIERSGDLQDIATKEILYAGVFVFVMGINEEIMFRLAIQNYFAKKFKLADKKYWIAVALASILWSLGHANTLNPEWVKFAQVFPLGIAFGFLFKRFGIESAMAAHGFFNVIMMILQLQGFLKI